MFEPVWPIGDSKTRICSWIWCGLLCKLWSLPPSHRSSESTWSVFFRVPKSIIFSFGFVGFFLREKNQVCPKIRVLLCFAIAHCVVWRIWQISELHLYNCTVLLLNVDINFDRCNIRVEFRSAHRALNHLFWAQNETSKLISHYSYAIQFHKMHKSAPKHTCIPIVCLKRQRQKEKQQIRKLNFQFVKIDVHK